MEMRLEFQQKSLVKMHLCCFTTIEEILLSGGYCMKDYLDKGERRTDKYLEDILKNFFMTYSKWSLSESWEKPQQ